MGESGCHMRGRWLDKDVFKWDGSDSQLNKKFCGQICFIGSKGPSVFITRKLVFRAFIGKLENIISLLL